MVMLKLRNNIRTMQLLCGARSFAGNSQIEFFRPNFSVDQVPVGKQCGLLSRRQPLLSKARPNRFDRTDDAVAKRRLKGFMASRENNPFTALSTGDNAPLLSRCDRLAR